jgi:HEAT repeat protein
MKSLFVSAFLLCSVCLSQAAEAPAKEQPAAEPDQAAKIAALVEQLDAKEAPRRGEAAQALAEAKGLTEAQVQAALPKLLRMLDDPDDDAQWKATVALGALGPPAVPGLLDALTHEKERVRWKAENALKMMGAAGVPGLLSALQDKRARVRQSAAFLLGEMKDARGLAGLAAAMDDKDDDARWKSATSLTKFGPQATEVTAKVLGGGSIEARRCAAWVFQQTRDPAAVPALVKALKDADEQVRWKAAIALQKIGKDAAEPLLGILKGGGTDDEKSLATWILEGIKDIAVQTALRDLKGAQAPSGTDTPPRPRPATLPKSVALAVTSEPAKATVFVDDKYAGVTPVTVENLSPGHHFIKLTKRDHLPWTKLVELLYPQEKTHAKLAVKPKGSLLVTSDPPESEVYVDGEYEGKTPLEKKDLDANPYSIRVEKEHFQPWEAEVEVPAGQQVKAHATLKSKVEGWYLDRLKANPNDVSCHTELGHYYLVRGQLDPAVKAIARGVEVTGQGADTSGYASRLVQEIAKMWGQDFQFGGGLKVEDVRKALHATIHDVWKRHSDKAALKSFLGTLQQSVAVDFTKPPA